MRREGLGHRWHWGWTNKSNNAKWQRPLNLEHRNFYKKMWPRFFKGLCDGEKHPSRPILIGKNKKLYQVQDIFGMTEEIWL